MPRSRRRAAALTRASAVAFAAFVAASLAACTAPVSVEPAPDAANPACAPEMIALPDSLGTAALRKTTSQATAAWGDPAAVVLRCGVPTPGPTTDRCVSVNGVDWVIREASGTSATPSPRASASARPSGSASASGAGPQPSSASTSTTATEGGGTYILTTFGRTPATELLLDSSKISSATVLATLSGAVSKVPQNAKCVGQAEVAQLPNG